MLRITRLTDYGFILLAQMCEEEGALFNAKDLSEQLAIPLPTVSKVLKLLVLLLWLVMEQTQWKSLIT